MGTADRGEVKASEELLCEHVCLENEAHVQAVKLAPMLIVDWGEAQEADAVLATCQDGFTLTRTPHSQKRDALLKKYLGDHAETEEGRALFCIHNSLVLNKGLLYVSTMPKGEAEGILAFLVLARQHHVALNGVHHDMGHQGQQPILALSQECFCGR